MADVNANIGVNIDTSAALANLKNLQRQISAFHTSMAKSGAAASAVSAGYQQNLINSINQSGKFSASMQNIRSTTESFTNALEKNKLGMREYFRYSAASTKTFGKFFRTEFDTINKVARERVKTLQTQYIRMGRDANGAMKAIAVRPLVLDMKNLNTQTQIAAQRQALFNQLVKQGSTNLLNFGKNTQWAGRQLMVGFTVPLTMLGVVAGKTFMQIEEQAIRFRKVYGEMFTSDLEVDKAVADIQTLAKEFTKYGIAIEKTIQMAADAAQAGFMGKALEAQVTQATRLAILGGMEQEKALENTIALQNAFRVSTEDLASSINFLNAVENQTVLSLDDVSEAIPRVGPIITELGGDIRDLTFFLTAMKEGGVSAAQGANALKAGLGRLINPSRNATEFLGQLGINLSSIIENNAGDLRATVMSFARALEPLDDLTKSRAVEKVFGKFQFARTLALLNNITRDGTQASRVLKLTAASVEELAILAERELGQVEDSTTFRFKKAVEEIKAAIAPIGGEFLKALAPIIEIGTKILEAFNNLDSGTKTFIVNITGIVGVIGPVFLMMFGLVANGFANLIKMFAFLGKAFSGTRSSTTDLAAQTQYMTNEQLKAAAVAASLDQTHMKLRQTFTSEASAVNALTSAYQRATVAQSGLNAAAVSRTRPVPGRGPAKYASGILSVPGPKGAGDIVPAMLSPGEAVIPAKQAQKYSGIVSSLISDNVPGFRFGRNPFASMLGRSRVAARMKDQDFMSALAAKGKNARYESAFSTGTGADYLNRSGSVNERQKLARSAMERDLFGLDPKTTPISSRPTYGYARTSILQSLINNMFGLKGRNFNAISAGPRTQAMDRYGNIDLVTKSSVAKRSSAYLGDTLMDYVRTVESRTRRYPNFNTQQKDLQMPLASMRGASDEQLKYFERLRSPFGSNRTPGENSYWTNPKNPYIETQTPGGFSFKEIDKVIARDPAIARQIRAELKAAGLGGVKVSGGGFLERLLGRMGVQGYAGGTSSVSKGNPRGLFTGYMSGTTGAAFAFTDEDKKIFRNLNVDGVSQKRYGDYLQYQFSKGRNYKTVPSSLADFAKYNQSGIGREILARLAQAGVNSKTAISIMSDTSKMAKTTDAAKLALTAVKTQIQQSVKPSGKIDNDALKNAVRKNLGISKFQIKKEFAHIGPGAQITAAQALKLVKEGKLPGLSKAQVQALKQASPSTRVDIKSGLGFDIENTQKDKNGKQIRLNAQMDNKGGGAPIAALVKEFKRSGVDKWNSSIRFGGGDPSKLAGQAAIFDRKLIENLSKYPDDVKVVDSESRARQLIQKGVRAVSMERIYSITQQEVAGATKELQKVLKTAEQTPTEIRSKDIKSFKSPGSSRAPIGGTLQALSNQMTPFQKLFSKRFPFAKQLARGTDSVPGYANGVVSVPGPKGAGDVVPAMLSPGEAVIPASMSKKYAPLINSMISDSIPGYKKGKKAFNFGDKYTGTQGLPLESAPRISPTLAGKQMLAGFGSGIKRLGTTLGDRAGISLIKAQNAASRKMDSIQEKRASRAASKSKPAFIGPLPEQPVKEKTPGRAMGIAAGVGMIGAMGGSMMPGKIGEIAQQAMMPIMMMSMMLPMLSNPIVLAVAALGGLAVAAFMLDQQFKENIKKAYELETAMGSGTAAIQPLAEAAGNVTAGEIMDRRRSSALDPFTVQPGKTTFGQNFVQSDAGQSLKATVSESFVELGRDTSVSKLVNQMATAVMSGAVSPSQARSVVAALAQELGDTNLGVRVNAQLTELLGPNGENILTKGLEIKTKLIEDSRENIKLPGGRITAEDTATKFSLGDSSVNLPFFLNPKIYEAAFDFFKGEDVTKQRANAGEIGSFVASTTNALQVQKQMTDSLQLEYEQKVKNAKIAIDNAKTEKERKKAVADLADIESKYIEDRNKLSSQNKTTIDQIKEQIGSVRNQTDVLNAYRNTALDIYKDDSISTGILGTKGSGGLLDRIDTEGEDKLTAEQSIVLNAELVAKNIDPTTLSNILDGENAETVVGIITKFGGTEADRFFDVANLITDEQKKIDFLVDVEKGDISLEELESLESLYKLTASSTAGDIVLNAYVDGEALKDDWNKQKAALEAAAEKGPVTLKTIQELEQKGVLSGTTVSDTIRENQEYFDSLPEEDKMKYVQSITVAANLQGDPAIMGLFRAWQLENGGRFSETTGQVMGGGTFQQFLHDKLGFPITQAGQDTTGEETTPDPGTEGSGVKKESPYKDILKDLKELRQDAVNATGGIKELLKWLGQGKDMRPFKGTMNALVAGGTTEEFQSFVSGLDKNAQQDLFKINKGVAELTNKGKAVQKAFNEISIGRFVIEQQRSVANSKNQEIAAKRLIAAGMDTASAYEAVGDAAFAAGIAAMKLGKKGREELKTIVNSAKEAEAAILKAMSPEELGSLLREAVDASMDKVQIDFEFAISTDMGIVRAAEAEIAALQFILDDYQAEIQQITWKESEINEKYDKRAEALEKVKEINSEIAAQQKGQLSVAEAITRGDLAGTARAVQELREAQATRAFERQSLALSTARERELGSLKSSKGRSRLQVEELILEKEKEIFKIEEERLEPARERIRLLEVEKDKTLASLRLQNLSYDRMINNIKLAEFGTKAYAEKLKEALAILQQMAAIKLPGDEDSKFKPTPGNLRPGPEKDGTFTGQLGPQGNFVWNGQKWVKTESSAGSAVLSVNPNFKPTPGNLRPGPEKDGTTIGQVGPQGNFVWNGQQWVKKASGGMISYYPMGGRIPYLSEGGDDFTSVNSDSVPAMLTPGEYVIKRQMVNKYGTQLFDRLNSGAIPGFGQKRYKFNTPNFSPRSSKINIDPSANSGGVVATSNNSSVYNYSLSVNVASMSDPNTIAQTVMGQIRRVDAQRLRGNRF